MSKALVFNTKGKKVGTVSLPAALSETKVTPALIHQVAIGILSNRRKSSAHTKTRGEVRGGGRKPWRQKGTGRARAGSIRSPLWRGGGVVFGPRNVRNFEKTLSQEIRRRAFFQVFSEKVRQKKVIVLADFSLKEPKTKKMVEILGKLGASGRILVLLDSPDTTVRRAARNIPKVSIRPAKDANVADLLSSDTVVLTKKSVSTLKDLL